jgi:hypothetical protein
MKGSDMPNLIDRVRMTPSNITGFPLIAARTARVPMHVLAMHLDLAFLMNANFA